MRGPCRTCQRVSRYWRFINRRSVDGAIRSAAGPALEAECLALPTLPKEEVRRVRRDITRWTSGVKEGNSAPVRCPTGRSVVTSAPGDLDAAHLVHAVAPDSEFGYEGLYTGALRDEEVSNVHQDSPAASLGRHPSWLQFSPPDQLLFGAWHSALGTAAALGAASVAAPLLGAGVKGWRPTTATALGLEARRTLPRRTPSLHSLAPHPLLARSLHSLAPPSPTAPPAPGARAAPPRGESAAGGAPDCGRRAADRAQGVARTNTTPTQSTLQSARLVFRRGSRTPRQRRGARQPAPHARCSARRPDSRRRRRGRRRA